VFRSISINSRQFIIKYSKINDLYEKNPFEHIKIKGTPSPLISQNDEELEKIRFNTLNDQKLDEARIVFLLQYYLQGIR
jgi:hypothetical protein